MRTHLDDTYLSTALAVVAFGASAVATWLALRFLKHRQIVDTPNERSSHERPTPRGLGIAVVPIVLLSWVAIATYLQPAPRDIGWVCAGASLLAVVSWIDDVKGLPVKPRLLAQALVVVAGVWCFEDPQVLDQIGTPTLLSQGVALVLWLGLINQVNFTDGIDGNLGTMLVSVGVGLSAVAMLGGGPTSLGACGLTLAAASAGFLLWNWHPAKGFMGDVGSVPLGFLVGWLLLRMASYGLWAPVLIVPLFYFADTAVTYSSRIARRTKFWRPHREYLYQRAAITMGHARVVRIAAGCNLVLLALAILSVRGQTWLALCAAVVVVACTLAYLARGLTRSAEG